MLYPGFRHGAKDQRIWRISTTEKRLLYRRNRGITRKWVCFGTGDRVFVRQKDASGAVVRPYLRLWRLDFLADVMLLKNFESFDAARTLQLDFGLRVPRTVGSKFLNWAIMSNWKMVKEYVAKKHGIDLEADLERHNKNIVVAENFRDDQSLEIKERLEAISIVERGLGRRFTVAMEVEKKDREKEGFDETKKQLFGLIEGIKNEPAEPPKPAD